MYNFLKIIGSIMVVVTGVNSAHASEDLMIIAPLHEKGVIEKHTSFIVKEGASLEFRKSENPTMIKNLVENYGMITLCPGLEIIGIENIINLDEGRIIDLRDQG